VDTAGQLWRLPFILKAAHDSYFEYEKEHVSAS
jgi:hypothetical protein